jgi:hypothetical protein
MILYLTLLKTELIFSNLYIIQFISKGIELEFRNPQVKFLWDKWRNVWMLAWERQRRLEDKLNYIEELDRVANFSWENWRKRVIILCSKLLQVIEYHFLLVTQFKKLFYFIIVFEVYES